MTFPAPYRAGVALALALVSAACAADVPASARKAAAAADDSAASAKKPSPERAERARLRQCVADLRLQYASADTSTAPATPADSAAGATAGKPAAGAKAAPARDYNAGEDPAFAVKMGWPTTLPQPLPGAILPCQRIVAYYGNPFSKKMGVLGEYPVDEMLRRFDAAVALWNDADPKHPVKPALQLVTVVADGLPGDDGMYRHRMSDATVEKVYGWAKRKDALLILDVQVGRSTLQNELPQFEKYLKNPDVHLAIDPEFSMHHAADGAVPGTKIGQMTAADVNYALDFLEGIVQKYHLPPKILVVHRFTRNMVPDAEQIRLRPHVQVVMNMDGWGAAWLKRDSYRDYIVRHPVEFTGFKIFYHNDVRKEGWKLMTPEEVLRLRPMPLYVQYQ